MVQNRFSNTERKSAASDPETGDRIVVSDADGRQATRTLPLDGDSIGGESAYLYGATGDFGTLNADTIAAATQANASNTGVHNVAGGGAMMTFSRVEARTVSAAGSDTLVAGTDNAWQHIILSTGSASFDFDIVLGGAPVQGHEWRFRIDIPASANPNFNIRRGALTATPIYSAPTTGAADTIVGSVVRGASSDIHFFER